MAKAAAAERKRVKRFMSSPLTGIGRRVPSIIPLRSNRIHRRASDEGSPYGNDFYNPGPENPDLAARAPLPRSQPPWLCGPGGTPLAALTAPDAAAPARNGLAVLREVRAISGLPRPASGGRGVAPPCSTPRPLPRRGSGGPSRTGEVSPQTPRRRTRNRAEFACPELTLPSRSRRWNPPAAATACAGRSTAAASFPLAVSSRPAPGRAERLPSRCR